MGESQSIEAIGVAGAGFMGSGIVESAARAGVPAILGGVWAPRAQGGSGFYEYENQRTRAKAVV